MLSLLTGGCPQTGGGSAVTALIGISSTSGDPPLTVAVSAADSTSARGAIDRVLWDFGDGTTSTEMMTSHTYIAPGYYPITLLVTDVTGAQGQDGVAVRVRGAAPTAVLTSDITEGAAPLVVRFDASASSSPDDTIRDYFWDFGDGEVSRQAAPVHVYRSAGAFEVALRVVTGGGVEATAATTIEVRPGAGGGSLQFNGGQFATLPVSGGDALTSFSLTIDAKPDAVGGTLALFGSPQIALELDPASGEVRIRQGGQEFSASGFRAEAGWQTVRLDYDGASGATIVVAGVTLTTAPLSGPVDITTLTIGSGFRGNVANVRLTTDSETFGFWPFDDGAGQTLRDASGSGAAGTRGATAASEASDPAWSSDSP